MRALASVRAQSHADWKLVIVNDSPGEDYRALELSIADDSRIAYLPHEQNKGKNSAMNTALALLDREAFGGYVVFLDDDDWLHPDALSDFAVAIEESPASWLVSARGRTDGTMFTKNATGRNSIHYYRDYLIAKRFSGDATHCLYFPEICSVRFPRSVKNAEEWLYFAHVATHVPKFRYLPSIGTYSEGYLQGGLTSQTLSLSGKLERYRDVSREVNERGLWNVYCVLYMLLRLGKVLVP